ncbi:MAG: hypothetical protein V7637_3704 [Mycobacteriales bacterium]|jgi:hypothetical protein
MRRTACLVGLAAAIAVCMPAGPAAAAGWAQVPTPDPGGSDFNSLPGLATVSPTEAWAVGLTRGATATVFRPLIEHWTAAGGWQLTASATTPATADSRLAAAAAVSPSNVWAVGQTFDSSFVSHGFIEHWAGAGWQRVAAATGEPAGAALTAVAAVSASDVWAVGFSQDPATFARTTLAEHWDGTAWRLVPTPPLPGTARFAAVAAVSAADVWAVGQLVDAETPFAEHWDGTRWTQVPLPATGRDSLLSGVTAVAGGNVWAVGTQRVTRTLVEHWDGTAWTVVPSPNVTGQTHSALFAVSAAGPADIWAVGDSLQNAAFASTLTEHWDGTAWTIVPSPNAPASFSTRLLAVQTHPGWPLFAVGDAQSQTGPTHTFAIRFS